VKLRDAIIKQLNDIKQLKDNDVLTDEEFQCQKKKLFQELTNL